MRLSLTQNLRTIAALAAGLLLTGTLAGCNLFGSEPAPFISKPASLHPESDAFAETAVRGYVWKESLRTGGETGGEDSLLANWSLEATRTGDSLVNGSLLPRITLEAFSAGTPAPAAALARLGFRPAQVLFDTSQIPDPGPSLGFPATPVLGWRLDTTLAGGLRIVRVLDRVETIKLSGKRHECWAFAESTFWAGELLGSGTTWMGRTGLVRHRSEWSGFVPSSAEPGILFREITAP